MTQITAKCGEWVNLNWNRLNINRLLPEKVAMSRLRMTFCRQFYGWGQINAGCAQKRGYGDRHCGNRAEVRIRGSDRAIIAAIASGTDSRGGVRED